MAFILSWPWPVDLHFITGKFTGPKTVKMQCKNISAWLQQGLYFLILLGLVIFLLRQGEKPWLTLLSHWSTFLVIIFSTSLAIIVQAGAFQWCLLIVKAPKSSFCNIVRAWSIGALTSLLAPLVAGLAVRAYLLRREGISLKSSSMATMCQVLFNLEYAFLSVSTVLIIYPWSQFPWLGWFMWLALLMGWLIKILLRRFDWVFSNKLISGLSTIIYSPPLAALPWLWGQIVFLTLNYWIVFNLFGILLTWPESILLAAISIFMSIAFFIPNGLGVLDALWVSIANNHGIPLGESVGLVLILRLGHLMAALVIWSSIELLRISNIYCKA